MIDFLALLFCATLLAFLFQSLRLVTTPLQKRIESWRGYDCATALETWRNWQAQQMCLQTDALLTGMLVTDSNQIHKTLRGIEEFL